MDLRAWTGTTRVTLLLAMLGLIGCGGGQGRNRPLDVELAKSSLDTAMRAWIDGKQPADLKPGIIMGDFAWESGKTLVGYELVDGKEHNDGANLHVTVVREFKNAQGKTSKSEMNYIISTSPAITIFPQ